MRQLAEYFRKVMIAAFAAVLVASIGIWVLSCRYAIVFVPESLSYQLGNSPRAIGLVIPRERVAPWPTGFEIPGMLPGFSIITMTIKRHSEANLFTLEEPLITLGEPDTSSEARAILLEQLGILPPESAGSPLPSIHDGLYGRAGLSLVASDWTLPGLSRVPMVASNRRSGFLQTDVICPHWLPVVLSSLGLLACRPFRHRRRRRRLKLGLCVACGYNLSGLSEPRCPECATPFDATRFRGDAGPSPVD